MIKTLPQEIVREMELELVKEAQLELRVQEAWAAYAGKIQADTLKLAG